MGGQMRRCLLGQFALRNVQQHVNAANNSPLAIFDGSRIWSKPSTGSVRPFCNGLDSVDNTAFLQGNCHWTSIMWHWPAVGVVKLPTDTPLIRSEFRRSAGKFDCCGIEVSQSPLRIRGIDGRWQSINHLAEAPFTFAHCQFRFSLGRDIGIGAKPAGHSAILVLYGMDPG